jgi:nicotinate-nucleotide adenylyltransferase
VTEKPISSCVERVAVLGGAFDPFHNGHIAAIRHLLRSGMIDTVLVVPSGDRPDKPGVSPAFDRLEMTRRGVKAEFAGDPRVEVSDMQVSGEVDYGTIDLVRYFETMPSKEPYFVIGQELLKDLPAWKESDELQNKGRFLVLRRPGMGVADDAARGWNVTCLEPFGASGVDVSSTELRVRLRAGGACDEFMPKAVLAYCRERRLY